MKKIIALSSVLAAFALAVALCGGCGKKNPVTGQTTKMTSAEPTSFTEVTSKLDPGGTLYLYLGTEQWLKGLSDRVESLHGSIASIPDLQDHRDQIDSAFKVGTQLIKDSGLEDISGIGMSSIAREPGFYHNKVILHHYSGQGNGFIWTVFGKEPHALDGLDLAPTNAALVAFYDLDAAQAWSVIEKECDQSGIPQASEALKNFHEQFDKNSGMKWDDLINSLGGEYGIVVTLDDSKMVKIPLPTQEQLEIPEPGLMIVAKVKNDTIFNRIDEQVKKNPGRTISYNQNGLRMHTMPVPLPLPITLRPSIATSEGYLFLATSDALIEQALAVKAGKQAGLKSTDEFKKLADGVPTEGNQFCFLSQRFGKTFRKIQEEAMDMNKQTPPQVKELMRTLMPPDKAAFAFGVGANTDEGWMTVANSSQGGGKIVAASAAVVPALAAAVAIPNFVKGRETAQRNACINNLRIIDAAKQQWALEKSKTGSATPTWDDLQPYLTRGQATFHCPKGGEYTLNSVDQKPTCSIPGHTLP